MIWLTRGGLLALLVLGLAWKFVLQTSHAMHDRPAALTWALQGELRGPVISTAGGETVIIEAPVKGCAAALEVVPVTPSFSTAPLLALTGGQQDHHLYAYLDWISERPNRWALLRRRLKDKVEQALGVSPYVVNADMLYVSEEQGCHVAKTMPWERYWRYPNSR